MKLGRYIIAFMLLTIYCTTSAASAYLSVSCHCVAPHKAAHGCCAHHAAPDDSATTAFEGICCDNHHSTEISLYRAPGDDNNAVRLRCAVLHLPPRMVAECPAPTLTAAETTTTSSTAPPVMAGYGATASLRAPPALV